MNRLIIIGNGFDLAHQLPTSYDHFLSHLLKVGLHTVNDPTCQHFEFKSEGQTQFTMSRIDPSKFMSDNIGTDRVQGINGIASVNDYLEFVEDQQSERILSVSYQNDFLRKILEHPGLSNWVDIEYFYFDQLVKIKEIEDRDHRKIEILRLNEGFGFIQSALEKYLSENIPRLEAREVLDSFYSVFARGYKNDRAGGVGKINLSLILNFNYTNTINYHRSVLDQNSEKIDLINIHGQLNSENESMIFGFGDEENDHYHTLENLNDNKFLEYMKYFRYLKNDNYNRLARFIQSKEEFEVFVIGHSCGISDRTLLRFIFEHETCKQIHVFYHKSEENYIQTVQEISRHFNDKKMFLDKVQEIDKKNICPQLTLYQV